MVYYSAKENDINPVLLLAKLQDEQSLLARGYKYGDFERRLEIATGYGISDSNPSDKWLGFYPQLVASSYQWHEHREGEKTFEEAYKSYTSGEGKYTGFTQADGIYAKVAENMNVAAGTHYAVQPEYTGYYNDFRDITIENIQAFLELYSSGALSNQNLFGEPPIENSQVTYTCDDSDTPPPVDDEETPPSITIKTVDKANGDIQLSGTGLGTAGIVKVGEQEVQAQWTDEGISLNLFETTGITLANMDQPLQIAVFDTEGHQVIEVCYPFVDVCPGPWYAKPIMKLWTENVVNGYSGEWAGYFKPAQLPTRSEYVAATLRASHPNENYDPATVSVKPFDDVELDNGYVKYIQVAKEEGVVQGCNEAGTEFCPQAVPNRAEAVKIPIAAFGDKFQTMLDAFSNGTKTPANEFSDVADNSQWFYPYVYTANEHYMARGFKDNFKPTDPVNRGEMAKIICVAAFGIMDCMELGLVEPLPDITPPDDGTTDPTDPDTGTTPDDGQTGDDTPSDPTDPDTPDDGQTPPEGDGLDSNDYVAGDSLAAITLGDGSIATTCTFEDIDQDGWFAGPVNALCSAGILIGYSESGQRVYKPAQEANLVEVLKVLLYASDYERVGTESADSQPEWYSFFVDDALNKGLAIDTSAVGDPVLKSQAMAYLAQLFYDYTGSDAVQFLMDKDITSGQNADENINRAELATLAYRAANDTNRYIHYGLVGSPPPALPDSSNTAFGQAVADQAADNVGVTYPYVDSKYTYCARFVRSMFEKPAIWGDAKSMCNHYDNAGLMETTQEPPTGAVVCYLPSSSNWNYGHVAIATGNGTEIGATSRTYGVTERDIYVGTGYQGWISAEDYDNNYPQ